MTHREDVFFLFPLLFLYIIPYTFYFFRFDKRSWLCFAEVLFCSFRKVPKRHAKGEGVSIPPLLWKPLPANDTRGACGPLLDLPGMDDARSEVLFIFSKTISARSGSSAAVHTCRSALAISPRKLLLQFSDVPGHPLGGGFQRGTACESPPLVCFFWVLFFQTKKSTSPKGNKFRLATA